MKQLKSSCAYYRKKRTVVALLRFLVFISMILSFIGGYQLQTIWYASAVMLLLVFIGLIVYHDTIKKGLFYRECKLEVLQDIKKRKNHEWTDFKEDGSAFVETDDLAAKDLDIFGHASLYQYLCCAATPYGRREFAQWLKQPASNITQWKKRQDAVVELSQNMEFSRAFMTCSKIFAHRSKIQETTMYKIVDASKNMKPQSAACRMIRFLGPTIMLVLFVFAILETLAWPWLFVWFVIQAALAMLLRKSCDERLTLLSHTQSLMDTYERMFRSIELESFSSQYLRELHDAVFGATLAVKKLSTLIGFANARNNDITYLIGSGFFLMDLQFVSMYEAWKRHYGKQLEAWLRAAGNMEALLSLSMLNLVRDDVCVPTMGENPKLSFTNAVHPLLDERKAVGNTFTLSGGTCVITGSNMSGKTTFLRTIGLNMTLFNAGGFVCAKEWISPMMNIYTSMRVEDNVDQGISTFYAEILRIKTMMQAMEKQEPMLVLIDEIFKGTNSADRIIGAQEAVKRLHQPWVMTFVSTHDFELCMLEDDPMIQACNMHFREYYEDNEIRFDYLLRKGRCQTTNARQLMRMAGIID